MGVPTRALVKQRNRIVSLTIACEDVSKAVRRAFLTNIPDNHTDRELAARDLVLPKRAQPKISLP